MGTARPRASMSARTTAARRAPFTGRPSTVSSPRVVSAWVRSCRVRTDERPGGGPRGVRRYLCSVGLLGDVAPPGPGAGVRRGLDAVPDQAVTADREDLHHTVGAGERRRVAVDEAAEVGPAGPLRRVGRVGLDLRVQVAVLAADEDRDGPVGVLRDLDVGGVALGAEAGPPGEGAVAVLQPIPDRVVAADGEDRDPAVGVEHGGRVAEDEAAQVGPRAPGAVGGLDARVQVVVAATGEHLRQPVVVGDDRPVIAPAEPGAAPSVVMEVEAAVL